MQPVKIIELEVEEVYKDCNRMEVVQDMEDTDALGVQVLQQLGMLNLRKNLIFRSL